MMFVSEPTVPLFSVLVLLAAFISIEVVTGAKNLLAPLRRQKQVVSLYLRDLSLIEV